MSRSWIAALIAVAVGIVAWEAVVPSGTRKEAWDIPVYWKLAYPAMLAGSLALGWIVPEQPWRWGLLVGLGQGVWTLAKATMQSGLPSLWPLGLIIFAILSLPCIAMAYLGARLR